MSHSTSLSNKFEFIFAFTAFAAGCVLTGLEDDVGLVLAKAITHRSVRLRNV